MDRRAAAPPCLAALVGLAACGSAARAPSPSPSPPRAPAPRPHVPQPLELVMHGAPADGARRAVLARNGNAWLRLGDAPVGSPGWRDPDGAERVVADLHPDRVQLLHETEAARLLVWVDRADLAPVVVREVGLGGATLGQPGVVLEPGARVTPGDRSGATTAVSVVAPGLALGGRIDTDAVGDVWTDAPEGEAGETHELRDGVVVRAAPGDAAAALATTTAWVAVRALGDARDGWRAVEVHEAHVIVRGFVPEATLDAAGGDLGGTLGSGWGATGAVSVDVPAGTCLYDAIEGQVVGLVTAAGKRLAYGDHGGWYRLLYDSPWGVLEVPAHSSGDGPAITWARCGD